MSEWGLSFTEELSRDIAPVEVESKHQRSSRRVRMVECLSDQYLYRRAYSELALVDMFADTDFRQGQSYHCISSGDVDSLSYLMLMLRKTDVRELLLSTWCMSGEDIFALREKCAGVDVHIFVGEIFPSSYKVEWQMLMDWKSAGADVRCFRNHSKIICGRGGHLPFSIESSANVNTNPRTEQTVLTIDAGLADFYFDWFDKIVSIK